jgi:hypothetical protein
MSTPSSSTAPGRVPYAGIWLDHFSLTAVSGGVLLAGGEAWQPDGMGTTPRASEGAAFWDTAKEAWLTLPPMSSPRFDHAAVALPDGRVLLVGGRTTKEPELRSTLFWEPRTQRFEEGPALRDARARPVAVTLPEGAVLVLGSDFDDDLQRGTRAELLRRGASAWESAGQTARIFHLGPVCVSQHRVVIAGGRDNGFGFAIIEGTHYVPPLAESIELWEGEGRGWRTAGPMLAQREEAQGVTLSDGRILVVGGWHEGQLLNTAEVWDPRTESWSPAGTLSLSRSSFALVALPEGRAAVSGGLAEGPFAETTAVEIWDPQRNSWSPGTPLALGRAGHQLAAVGGGTFLVVGNSRPSPDAPPETTWELWRPVP